MRLGIDIRKYNDYGIGTYIQNLVNGYQNEPNLECIYFAQDELQKTLNNTINGRIITDNSSKYSLRELFSVSKKANAHNLDVFHAPHYTLPINLKMPSIVTIHDIIHLRLKEYFSYPKRAYAYRMIKHACFSSSAIIVDSEFGKNELLSIFDLKEEKIHVVSLGVNQMYFGRVTVEQKEIFLRNCAITKPYILYTGSLKPHKNVSILLKAFKKIAVNNDLQIVFAGEKVSENAQLRQYIIDNNLANSVIDLGRINLSQLKIAYQAATVVVLPSLYEGFGFSMVEAMASGVPAIGARATSITEVVGDAGLLFNPTDDNDLIHQIDRVIHDSNLRAELITKGTERAHQFTWKRCIETTLKIYKEVIT